MTTDLKPGDIITAYCKGIHEVVEVKGDMVKYLRRLNSNGAKAPMQLWNSHIKFCKKATQETIDARYAKDVAKALKLKTASEELLKGAICVS